MEFELGIDQQESGSELESKKIRTDQSLVADYTVFFFIINKIIKKQKI